MIALTFSIICNTVYKIKTTKMMHLIDHFKCAFIMKLKKCLKNFMKTAGMVVKARDLQDLVYLPQMWSINTDAMNKRDITNTGTGPLKKKKKEISIFYIPEVFKEFKNFLLEFLNSFNFFQFKDYFCGNLLTL